jgi:hypothetical protein
MRIIMAEPLTGVHVLAALQANGVHLMHSFWRVICPAAMDVGGVDLKGTPKILDFSSD